VVGRLYSETNAFYEAEAPYRYWSLEDRPHRESLLETAERVCWLLRDSVERRLVSDVPVCTFLSGGLDSSAVSAFAAGAMRRAGAGPLHTYSVDYAGNERFFTPDRYQPGSDTPWVRRTAGYLRTKHRRVTFDTAELVQALVDSTLARDLPGMADVDSSLLLFCREIKKEATVALSGEAADEVFGGYPWYREVESTGADTFPWARGVETRARVLSRDLREMINPAEYVAERYREALAEVPLLPGEDPASRRMRQLFHLNLTRFMPTLLDRKDRMSMAAGLEVRVPYCDHRLVEYAWNIPWHMKLCDDREKGLLRRALRGILPRDVLQRRKSPYPKTHNPHYLTAVRDQLSDVLHDRSSPLLPLIDAEEVLKLTESTDSGPHWFGQLMGRPQLFAYLIQVDQWLRWAQPSIDPSAPV